MEESGIVVAVVSAVAAIGAVVVAWLVYKRQESLARGQLLLPLWERLTALHRIDPKRPVITHLLDAVNTLQLVAICYESHLVDQRIMMRAYGNEFKRQYEDIEDILNPIEVLEVSNGKQLLEEHAPAATQLYKQLFRGRQGRRDCAATRLYERLHRERQGRDSP